VPEASSMVVFEKEARVLAAHAFLNAGVTESAAWDAAEILTLAEMMGIGTHGLRRVRVYCDRISKGGIDPKAVATVLAPAPAIRLVDGQNGLGPAIARQALAAAQEAAREVGIGAAFCRGGNHLGALAPYLWLATEARQTAIVTTNTAPMMAPAGGRLALVGNNPLGIGIPNPGGAPILLDMAMSVAARSRVRAAKEAGDTIPSTWATDADGQPTTDPAKAMQGLMQAIGGGKGANLSLCLDLLVGALSGSAMLSGLSDTAQEPGKPQDLAQMILLIDTERLVATETLAQRMAGATATVTESAAVDPATPVRMPGARAVAALLTARETGMNLSAPLIGELRELARS